MNGSECLRKIDRLIDAGNGVWENPGSKAQRDIARFCCAVKDLVLDIYGAEHPYIKLYEGDEDVRHDLGQGMAALKSIRLEVDYWSNMGH